MFESKKQLRLLMVEVELHGGENKNKKEIDEKKSFFKKFSLKVIEINSYK